MNMKTQTSTSGHDKIIKVLCVSTFPFRNVYLFMEFEIYRYWRYFNKYVHNWKDNNSHEWGKSKIRSN